MFTLGRVFNYKRLNEMAVMVVHECGSLHEKRLPVIPVGSALGADKKINLALGIFVIVDALSSARAAAKRRPTHV
jgi:hypothetical protein